MNWNNSKIETSLANAVTEIVPDLEDAIWDAHVSRAGSETVLPAAATTSPARKTGNRRAILAVALAAACLILMLLPLLALNRRVESTVYIDVNPSLELQLDQRDKVLRALPNNADGEAILADMDLKGVDVDVAVNALLGSMFRLGYLNETANEVLLSVESRSTEKAESLSARISETVEECLHTAVGAGTVYAQNVQGGEDLRTLAKQFDISVGRAWLLEKITAVYPDLSIDYLSGLSIHELCQLLRGMGVDPEDFIEMYGDDSPVAGALEDLVDDLNDDEDDDPDDVDDDNLDDVDDDEDDDPDDDDHDDLDDVDDDDHDDVDDDDHGDADDDDHDDADDDDHDDIDDDDEDEDDD